MTKLKTLLGAPEPPRRPSTEIYSHALEALSDLTHLTAVLSEGAEPSVRVKVEATSREAVERIIWQVRDRD